MFAIFINDIASEIKESNIGIDLNIEGGPNIEYIFNILLYADDIVCLDEYETDVQEILTIIENWCKKFRLEINLTKTNILHVINKRKQQSKFTFSDCFGQIMLYSHWSTQTWRSTNSCVPATDEAVVCTLIEPSNAGAY